MIDVEEDRMNTESARAAEYEWRHATWVREFRSRVTRELCARVGNHDTCDLGVTLGEVAAEVARDALTHGEIAVTMPPASGPDYESPRQICYEHGPHGEICDRQRGHAGEHVDATGPVVGGVWANAGGETRGLDDVRIAVRDPRHCGDTDGDGG